MVPMSPERDERTKMRNHQDSEKKVMLELNLRPGQDVIGKAGGQKQRSILLNAESGSRSHGRA